MNNIHVLYILLAITAITSIFDFYTSDINQCLKKIKDFKKKYMIVFNIIFHHFFANFSFIGWLFTNPIILLIFCISPIIVAVHWFKNKNKCFITEINNKLCKFTEYKEFNEITTLLDLNDTSFSLLFSYKSTAFLKASKVFS